MRLQGKELEASTPDLGWEFLISAGWRTETDFVVLESS